MVFRVPRLIGFWFWRCCVSISVLVTFKALAKANTMAMKSASHDLLLPPVGQRLATVVAASFVSAGFTFPLLGADFRVLFTPIRLAIGLSPLPIPFRFIMAYINPC